MNIKYVSKFAWFTVGVVTATGVTAMREGEWGRVWLSLFMLVIVLVANSSAAPSNLQYRKRH